MNNKIGKTHLQRRAVVYLRQSTSTQVEYNRESTERQYAHFRPCPTVGLG